MHHVDGHFHTSDMALVAYLTTRFINHCDIRMPERSAIWYFEESDELRQEVAEYSNGEAMVEPKEFMRGVARVRDEMYSKFGLGRSAARG